FAVVRLAMLPIPIAVAMWAQDRHIGLLNWLALPGWVAGIATFLLMDYAYWWWHWANHMVPLFWRFHNVHHTDIDLDFITAARSFVCGTNSIARCAAIFRRTPSPLALPRIARTTN